MPRGRIPEAWLPHVVVLAATSSSLPPLRRIDVFSGPSRYYKQMLKDGMLCERMDISIDKRHDVTKEAGVAIFISAALRCVPGESLVVMGPPCSFFIATSSKQHGRTVKKPMGNGSPFAKQGNRIATFISNAILLCAYLSIMFSSSSPPLQNSGTYFECLSPWPVRCSDVSHGTCLCSALARLNLKMGGLPMRTLLDDSQRLPSRCTERQRNHLRDSSCATTELPRRSTEPIRTCRVAKCTRSRLFGH